MKAKNPMDACYVMGLPKDCIILAQEEEMWKGLCSQMSQTVGTINLISTTHHSYKLKQDHEPQNTKMFVHGFIGYFTSELWPGVVIDTRHTSLRNCFHWGSLLLPA